ncbi:hypothetical protein GPECTOR_64g126 [Gonium pectorale]|uniref:Ankyrin repeat domain-containing protein n=1 Tax=Gonium pectorale TaxID=33097 RepID=A0A150G438_GONPE|nr:hypothetical protein GPECTOR_64g126 [Gonium pectorale]|eukprot:KXZ44632.1 hypothetical protein GPECTOR_64g126 [Gonium pectorale]
MSGVTALQPWTRRSDLSASALAFGFLASRSGSSVSPANIVACTIRVLDHACAIQYCKQTTVRLSQPVPPHAFARHWQTPEATRELTRAQRVKLVSLTATSGVVPNLKVALAASGLGAQKESLIAAGVAGQLHSCRWLLKYKSPSLSDYDVLETVAEAGQQAACELLLDSGFKWTWSVVSAATRKGHLGLALWLLSVRPNNDKAPPSADDYGLVLCGAMEGLDLASCQGLYFQFITSRGTKLSEARLKQLLLEAGSSPTTDWREKVAWLERLGCLRAPAACAKAAALPDGVERLSWLMARGCQPDGSAVYFSACAGTVRVGQMLLLHNLAPGFVERDNAAEHGHLAWLQATHVAENCRHYNLCQLQAARHGRKDVVEWMMGKLVGNGRAWREYYGDDGVADLVRNSATSGSVELLAWLRQLGFPWHEGALSWAVAGGASERVLEWMLEAGCPMPADGSAYIAASKCEDQSLISWLQRRGCPWEPQTFELAVSDELVDVPALRALLKAGCPVDWPAAVEAAVECRGPDHTDGVLAWLAAEAAKRVPQKRARE